MVGTRGLLGFEVRSSQERNSCAHYRPCVEFQWLHNSVGAILCFSWLCTTGAGVTWWCVRFVCSHFSQSVVSRRKTLLQYKKKKKKSVSTGRTALKAYKRDVIHVLFSVLTYQLPFETEVLFTHPHSICICKQAHTHTHTPMCAFLLYAEQIAPF